MTFRKLEALIMWSLNAIDPGVKEYKKLIIDSSDLRAKRGAFEKIIALKLRALEIAGDLYEKQKGAEDDRTPE